MRKIFEFTMPDDQDDYDTYSNAHRYRRALEEFREALRQVCKYGEPSDDDTKWREKFHEILHNNEVDI